MTMAPMLSREDAVSRLTLMDKQKRARRYNMLTDRRRFILGQVMTGRSYRAIAKELNISVERVRQIVWRIVQILEADTKVKYQNLAK